MLYGCFVDNLVIPDSYSLSLFHIFFADPTESLCRALWFRLWSEDLCDASREEGLRAAGWAAGMGEGELERCLEVRGLFYLYNRW